jgi:hypothetical protein
MDYGNFSIPILLKESLKDFIRKALTIVTGRLSEFLPTGRWRALVIHYSGT